VSNLLKSLNEMTRVSFNLIRILSLIFRFDINSVNTFRGVCRPFISHKTREISLCNCAHIILDLRKKELCQIYVSKYHSNTKFKHTMRCVECASPNLKFASIIEQHNHKISVFQTLYLKSDSIYLKLGK
jgi:hypothetical protein